MGSVQYFIKVRMYKEKGMALKNPYAKYANDRVITASPAELTLMLYEGAIKFCNLAKIDMEK